MFRLRVLGGFALEGRSEGSTFPVPQPRAEAVLAVLAGGLLVAIGVLAGLLVKAKPSAIPLDATAIVVLPFQVVGDDSGTRILARSMGVLFDLRVRAEFGRHIRYPGSVAQHWHGAGGTLDSAISEESELSVARVVGAGRLVRGTVLWLAHPRGRVVPAAAHGLKLDKVNHPAKDSVPACGDVACSEHATTTAPSASTASTFLMQTS